MTDLFAAVVSIAPTRRRRFLWAAWWTTRPARDPFCKPDASAGGARTREEALAQAEAAAGRTLTQIEPLWARAWGRVLMDLPPFPAGPAPDTSAATKPVERDAPASIWHTLGLAQNATPEQIRTAYRQLALTTHPDRGGDPVAFRQLHAAYQEALARRARSARRPRRRAR